jgi:hypothetical protein
MQISALVEGETALKSFKSLLMEKSCEMRNRITDCDFAVS